MLGRFSPSPTAREHLRATHIYRGLVLDESTGCRLVRLHGGVVERRHAVGVRRVDCPERKR